MDSFLSTTHGKGVPTSVDSVLFLEAHGRPAGHFGTWESLVQGVGSADSLRSVYRHNTYDNIHEDACRCRIYTHV